MNGKFKLFGCVLALIFNNEGKILAILRRNKPDAGNYNLVGGRMDDGETVAQAVIREIKEEVGLSVYEKDVEVVSAIHRLINNEEPKWNSIEFVVIIKRFEGVAQNLEPEFCERLDWLDADNLPENITPYAKIAIDNYLHKHLFSEVDS